MRIQCPECGILRPASADPCPSCGADAPSSSRGTRAGGGTSLRQWKERYQTGQLPGISPGASGIGSSRQFSRRTSGALTSGQSNPDWGNESPSSSIPPSAGLGRRRSGSLTPPPPPRQSGSISSSLWQRATDPTPPPPSRSSGAPGNSSRSSGLLSRNGGSEAGNTSTSWRWRKQGMTSGSGFSHQMDDDEGIEQENYQNDDQEEMPPQASGRFRSSSMLPVPYQQGRRSWNQPSEYGEMDEEGSSANLPATMDRQSSMAFPMMEDALLERLAPGRKPPAFIPATRPRRPYRLSRYRILSGTISLALFLMTIVGGLAFLAIHSGWAASILTGRNSLAAQQFNLQETPLPELTGTPQATPSGSPASKIIVNVTTALHYTKTFDPINPSRTFKTGQNVNVLWKTKNAKVNDIISVIWYQSGTAVTNSSTPNTQTKLTKSTPFNGLFALCYPTSGLGKAELYWNGQLAQTIEFVVQGNPAQCAPNTGG